MNKPKNLIAFAIVAAMAVGLTSCQNSGNQNTTTNRPDNKSALNINQQTNAAAPANTSAPSAGSPTEAYKAAHAARKNNDVEALKKLMAKDMLEFMTELGQADEKNRQSLDEMLREMNESPQAATAEARNEKITGNTATIEYLDEKGQWRTLDFVKEDGAWKLTIATGGDIEVSDKPKKKK